MKKSEFDDKNIMRKRLVFWDERYESYTISNKAKESIYDKIVRNFEQSLFQDFESLFGTNRLEERVLKLALEKKMSDFVTHELPPRIPEVSDFWVIH